MTHVFLLLASLQQVSPEILLEPQGERKETRGLLLISVLELGEADERDWSESCSTCIFSEEEDLEQGINCSLVLGSDHCQYCNDTSQCQTGVCKHLHMVLIQTTNLSH